MSKTQQHIDRMSVGYRCEDNAVGVVDFYDVIKYETEQLHDLGIIQYVYDSFCSCLSQSTKQFYCNSFDYANLFEVLHEITQGNIVISVLDERSRDKIFRFIVQIVRDSSFHAYKGPLYCCWLTTKSACKVYYGVNVVGYFLPRRNVVVADKGALGVLYVATDIINSKKYKLKQHK